MFDDIYTRDADDGRGKSCILPFFGFVRSSGSREYTQGVYVPDPNAWSGQSKMYKTHSKETEHFSRHLKPSGKEAELEKQFVDLCANKKHYQRKAYGLDGSFITVNPWRMPHIPTSVEEYYIYRPLRLHRLTPKLALLWLFSGPLFLILPWITFFIFLLRKIINGIERILAKIHPYSKMSPKEKEWWRQNYFRYMKRVYGRKAGAILQEYAILRGYDRI